MSCRAVQNALSPFVDGVLASNVRQAVVAHLNTCEVCARRYYELTSLRLSLRSARPEPVPAELATSLQVMASREWARHRERATVAIRVASLLDRLHLVLKNLFEPLAIPAAGGLLSAIVLFALLAPQIMLRRVDSDFDISSSAIGVLGPVRTQAELRSTDPLIGSYGDLIVDLTVDEQGRMVDYALPYHPQLSGNGQVRRAIENSLLFARFTPATAFGQPITGKVRITLVNVRG